MSKSDGYRLDDQIGFILRQASQRHATIFAENIPAGLTSMQFAVLAKLFERGGCSQNRLGRLVSMDAATIKGVIDRLSRRGLVDVNPDPVDRRRLIVELTQQGIETVEPAIAAAHQITELTLSPLSEREQEEVLKLLRKMT